MVPELPPLPEPAEELFPGEPDPEGRAMGAREVGLGWSHSLRDRSKARAGRVLRSKLRAWAEFA